MIVRMCCILVLEELIFFNQEQEFWTKGIKTNYPSCVIDESCFLNSFAARWPLSPLAWSPFEPFLEHVERLWKFLAVGLFLSPFSSCSSTMPCCTHSISLTSSSWRCPLFNGFWPLPSAHGHPTAAICLPLTFLTPPPTPPPSPGSASTQPQQNSQGSPQHQGVSN